MSLTHPEHTRQIRSLVTHDGDLELFLVERPIKAPKADQVIVRIQATPINPSDLGLLLASADLTRATQGGTKQSPTITAPIPDHGRETLKSRAGVAMAVGTEGAGTVVAAGDSPEAQALLGHTVACLGGAMYTEYRTLPASACMILPDGTSPAAAAASYVNPLTALSFAEIAKTGEYHGIVHTAAASNLGRMLNRICIADNLPLINVVRTGEQEHLLREEGAQYVINTCADDWFERLVVALSETGATLGFDAVGGGPLAGQILTAMEMAATQKMAQYSRYGSGRVSHVYIYGRLDSSPITVPPNIGFAWNLSGFLMPPYLETLDQESRDRLHARVVDELTTTFASHYAATISLAGALNLDTLRDYNSRSTGAKHLIDPTLR
ncbi:hypothetical protein [Nocardioides sp. AE5]|uniref:hypothetical protein n=1 Tax=Nocardioides sp. AE5 TaxID=2962573 RepID=UPI002881C70E|nr:hypothetical protein [Nocardioides sp. AE5]MDT0203925.1 hypothetical protein [Nocardioides sp. AE5]